jgi:hypothetical protein
MESVQWVNLLRFAGRNGPWVVIIGVILGFGIPLLSNMARPYLARAIFLFTFGSFLKLDLSRLASSYSRAVPPH